MPAATTLSQIFELAQILEEDIRERHLTEGMRYRTTSETAAFLRIGGKLANQVLQVLEKKGVISRTQRRGAIITRKLTSVGNTRLIDRIYFVFGMEAGLSPQENEALVLGLQEKTPQAQLGIVELLPGQELDQIKGLIREALSTGENISFVLVRCSAAVQRLVNDCHFPAIVWGTCYPSITNLASIDRDYSSIATQFSEFVQRRNLQRVAYLTRQVVLPGNEELLNKLHGVLEHCVLYELFIPEDNEIIEATIRNTYEKYRPDVWFLHTRNVQPMLLALSKLFEENKDYHAELVVELGCSPYSGAFSFTNISTEIDATTIGRMLGNQLLALAQGGKPHRIRLPMQMLSPE